MGNLRDKKGKFTSQKQLANGESISCCCCFFIYIMIDTCVNSDLAKIVTFSLKLSTAKVCPRPRSHEARGMYPGKCGNR